MNFITVLTLASLASVFALWVRLEYSEFEHRKTVRVAKTEDSMR